VLRDGCPAVADTVSLFGRQNERQEKSSNSGGYSGCCFGLLASVPANAEMNNKSTQHIDSAQPVDELKNYIPIIADELELCKRQAMPCLGTLRLQLCRNVETIQNSTDRIVRVGTYGQRVDLIETVSALP